MPDPIYVAARRALLDLLEGLGPQRAAVILVGAQAVYLHTGEADFAVAPFTKDADLVLDRNRLLDSPLLTETLAKSGFVPGEHPGIWLAADRAQVTSSSRRPLRETVGAERDSVRLTAIAWRKAKGLEGAVVTTPADAHGAGSADSRRLEVELAGPAALLVAKLHKVADRAADARRSVDKDALDVFRLLRRVPNAVSPPAYVGWFWIRSGRSGSRGFATSRAALRQADNSWDSHGRSVARRS